jgi:hypothetical protein
MAAAFGLPLLGCDGCFVGLPAIISLVIAVLALIGTIYVLLWSNLGARVGYLVLMVSFFAWMIILSAMGLFGAPGTTPGTGPRGAEPQWVAFTPDSEQGQAFREELATFPGDGWSELDASGKVFPGKIDAKGELENVRTAIKNGEAALALAQKTRPDFKPEDYSFRPSKIPATTPDEENPELFPPATAAYKQVGNTLLFGARIPATSKHPEIVVFAYRDRGKVFLYALLFLAVSLFGFVLHLMLLGRSEKNQRRREAQLAEQEPRTPVNV